MRDAVCAVSISDARGGEQRDGDRGCENSKDVRTGSDKRETVCVDEEAIDCMICMAKSCSKNVECVSSAALKSS